MGISPSNMNLKISAQKQPSKLYQNSGTMHTSKHKIQKSSQCTTSSLAPHSTVAFLFTLYYVNPVKSETKFPPRKFVFFIKTNRFKLFREVAINCEDNTKQINQCVGKTERF